MSWRCFAADNRRPTHSHTRGADPSRNTSRWAGGCVTLLFSGGGSRRKKACRISLPADPAVCAPGVAIAVTYRTFRLLKWGRYFLLAANILLTISRISARLRTAEVRGSKMMD